VGVRSNLQDLIILFPVVAFFVVVVGFSSVLVNVIFGLLEYVLFRFLLYVLGVAGVSEFVRRGKIVRMPRASSGVFRARIYYASVATVAVMFVMWILGAMSSFIIKLINGFVSGFGVAEKLFFSMMIVFGVLVGILLKQNKIFIDMALLCVKWVFNILVLYVYFAGWLLRVVRRKHVVVVDFGFRRVVYPLDASFIRDLDSRFVRSGLRLGGMLRIR